MTETRMRKGLAMLMVLCMLLTMLPMSVFAATTNVAVGTQVGTITAAAAEQSATFDVTTDAADTQPVTISWFTDISGGTSTTEPTGILASGSDVSSGGSTITVNGDNTTTAGNYYFKVTIDGITSSVVTLTVADPDAASVATVKGLVAGATYTMTQAEATDEATVKTAIETVIAGLALEGVTTSVTKVDYTPAVAGDVTTPAGTDGKYTFTVELSKGSASDTTATLTMTVTATPYDADAASVATVKGLVAGATYTMTQAEATDEATVKTAIETVIAGLALEGVTTSVTKVDYTPAVAGDVTTPAGTDGKYTFTVELSKGSASDTTATLTMTVTATPYDADAASVATVKGLVAGATYTMTQAEATDEATVKTAIETVIAGLALEGVTTSVTKVDYTPAVAGDVTTPAGTDGKYTFTVGLLKGSASDTTATLTMTVTATPYDADAASVATVKGLVAGATYTMTQAEATDEATVKIAIETVIAGLALDGVTTSVTKVDYTPAVAGDVTTPAGTDGTYTFTVGLLKGSASDTTATLTMTVTATPYDADAASVATVKGLVAGATYTMTQAEATDEATVKTAIETVIAGLALDGVTTSVTKVDYTPAVAGDVTTPAGTDGTYTFTVGLLKGSASDTTATLTMTVTATPYDADAASVATVKGLVAGATYTMTQAEATDEATVKTAIETVIAGLALDGVTTSVTKVDYTPAVAGDVTTPAGTDGKYTFTVGLLKGSASDTTATLTMTVAATPYDADAASVATVKGLVAGATYTMTQAEATDEATVKIAIETVIAGLALDGVTTSVTKVDYTPAVAGDVTTPAGTDGTYTFTVGLLKGSASDTTATLTMTVTATPYDADAASVATVKGLVAGATYTMTQAEATDEATVKTAIETVIAGLALEGVTTSVTKVDYTPAVAGDVTTPAGTDGKYTFTVELSKGSASDTTATLTMTVTATPYDADAASVATVKGLVAGATYTMTQAEATDEATVKTAIETVIAGLALEGVTTSVTKVDYTPAVAGDVTTPAGTDGKYTFTVELSKGSASDTTATLTMTVTATPYDADADAASVAADKAALTSDVIKGGNADLENVTGALAALPTVGSVNGSAITWVSDTPTVVSNNGQTVVRPAFGAGDATVTLTATITKGLVTDTKVFTLIVKQQDSGYTLAIGTESKGGAGCTRTITIGGANAGDLAGKYLVVQFTEGTGDNAKVSVVMISPASQSVTVSYQVDGTTVETWLTSAMPNLIDSDMGVIVYAHQ
ncbi:immunoglobulin-like domain-containing protein [Ruminiclostridium cellulolyticum]|uniref:Atrophied bacterial Ig domain-containing protein n=1 Tax=Ruminiclostridium cellulolyticum (strain ATCC 35319 / DSM 5812 / JCM 6584 / H10) TaxID=394503 RepID=B8I8Y0_RUMCH|nr:immunoglobulin-like domain-containing protein [Ruminiclostridium cellulolyticum]ACL77312.1 hypothetical protein Ccel_3020 [Ruminiclostridium cellulolyticum H10]